MDKNKKVKIKKTMLTNLMSLLTVSNFCKTLQGFLHCISRWYFCHSLTVTYKVKQKLNDDQSNVFENSLVFWRNQVQRFLLLRCVFRPFSNSKLGDLQASSHIQYL